jgi:Ser/Thr protein kinase RdoA (MazF antagonist)
VVTLNNKSAIEIEDLYRAIQESYGIQITNLEFLLRGWGGDCYRIDTSDGERYFLKLHDSANYMGIAATSRPFYLPLMDQLHSKGILPNIPHPIRTRDGNLSLVIDSNEVVITNWIGGKLVGFGKLPEPILTQLAKMTGILHSNRSQLEFERPFVEKFEFGFASDLSKAVTALDTISPSDSPGIQLLRETILPHHDEVLKHLQGLRELQMRVRELEKPMVVCHTDLHGGNLMTDAQGNFYILDWENALIAPPEHDMIFFAGESNFWNVFWPEYTNYFKYPSLDGDMLSFYYYRRTLEDIAGFVLRILQGAGGNARDREDINWLRGCLADLVAIDNTVAKIQTVFVAL